MKSLGPSPVLPSPSPADFQSDPLPRRKVVRRMKEALVKSIILSGAPRVTQASFALNDALEPGDRDSSFVREGLELGEDLARRGNESRRRIYRDNSPLTGDTAAAMMDIGRRHFLILLGALYQSFKDWISSNFTYGVILSPISETTASAPLTLAETEMVVLSCLISQQAGREARWHFRGSLWNGLSEDEIESIQYAIETVAAECGVDVKSGMPRVHDLTEEEKQGRSKL